jgi:hypothetical protein
MNVDDFVLELKLKCNTECRWMRCTLKNHCFGVFLMVWLLIYWEICKKWLVLTWSWLDRVFGVFLWIYWLYKVIKKVYIFDHKKTLWYDVGKHWNWHVFSCVFMKCTFYIGINSQTWLKNMWFCVVLEVLYGSRQLIKKWWKLMNLWNVQCFGVFCMGDASDESKCWWKWMKLMKLMKKWWNRWKVGSNN